VDAYTRTDRDGRFDLRVTCGRREIQMHHPDYRMRRRDTITFDSSRPDTLHLSMMPFRRTPTAYVIVDSCP
jgi:hypothetical protein